MINGDVFLGKNIPFGNLEKTLSLEHFLVELYL